MCFGWQLFLQVLLSRRRAAATASAGTCFGARALRATYTLQVHIGGCQKRLEAGTHGVVRYLVSTVYQPQQRLPQFARKLQHTYTIVQSPLYSRNCDESSELGVSDSTAARALSTLSADCSQGISDSMQ